MLVLGAILFLVGALFLFAWQSARSRLGRMKSVAVSTVKDLADAFATARPARMYERADVLLSRPAAVEGIVRCDSPLISELGKVPCVFYKIVVKRRYRRRSKIEERRSQGVPFWVEDATGRILVDPTGANVDGLRVVNDFEPAVGRAMVVGDTTLHVAGAVSRGQELGAHCREEVVPLDRRVYVLGEASNGPDHPTIRKPSDNDGRLIISLRSGEELAEATDASTWWLLLLGLATSIAGAAAVAFELLR